MCCGLVAYVAYVAYYICDNIRDFSKMMGGRYDFRGDRGDLKYNIEWNESFELIVNRAMIISEGQLMDWMVADGEKIKIEDK